MAIIAFDQKLLLIKLGLMAVKIFTGLHQRLLYLFTAAMD